MTLLLLGLLGCLLHLTASQVRAFDHAAAADIASKLDGAGKQVVVSADVGPEALFGDVHAVSIQASRFSTRGLPLYTEPKRSHRGLVRMLHLELSDFTLRGLHIEKLSADIPGCHFDLPLAMRHKQIRLSESGTGMGEVSITQEDLERFILAKFPEIKRASVKIDDGKVLVEGYGDFLVVSTNFSIAARLEAPGGNTLELTDAKILFDGQPVDDAQRKVLLDALNPVVDLDQDLALDGAIRVQNVTLQGGVMTARGQVTIPEKPTTSREPARASLSILAPLMAPARTSGPAR